jgi:hypothetical protein
LLGDAPAGRPAILARLARGRREEGSEAGHVGLLDALARIIAGGDRPNSPIAAPAALPDQFPAENRVAWITWLQKFADGHPEFKGELNALQRRLASCS